MTTTEDTRDLTGPRASTIVRCVRAAHYQATDTPAAALPYETARYFRRGNLLADAWRDEVIHEYNQAGKRPRREEPIPWPRDHPIGTGHADLWIPSESRIVETYVAAGGTLRPEKARQATLYAINKQAENATLVVLDPTVADDVTGIGEHTYNLNLAADSHLVRDVYLRQTELVASLEMGYTPDRPVEHPGASVCRWCPFAATCWADWQPPDDGDELIDLDEPALHLADLEDAVKNLTGTLKAKKVRLEEARAELRDHIPADVTMRAGAVTIRRTEVTGRRTFPISDYEKAGNTLPADLAPWIKASAGHDRWTVDRAYE